MVDLLSGYYRPESAPSATAYGLSYAAKSKASGQEGIPDHQKETTRLGCNFREAEEIWRVIVQNSNRVIVQNSDRAIDPI
jgi:hypothetical protein